VLSIITLPIKLLLLPFRIFRLVASLRFSTVLAILAGAGASFAAARHLLASEANIEALPGPLRGVATAARATLLRWQGHAEDAQRAYDAGETDAEQDLRQDYLSRTGRTSD
jgi:hypothetical protein